MRCGQVSSVQVANFSPHLWLQMVKKHQHRPKQGVASGKILTIKMKSDRPLDLYCLWSFINRKTGQQGIQRTGQFSIHLARPKRALTWCTVGAVGQFRTMESFKPGIPGISLDVETVCTYPASAEAKSLEERFLFPVRPQLVLSSLPPPRPQTIISLFGGTWTPFQLVERT